MISIVFLQVTNVYYKFSLSTTCRMRVSERQVAREGGYNSYSLIRIWKENWLLWNLSRFTRVFRVPHSSFFFLLIIIILFPSLYMKFTFHRFILFIKVAVSFFTIYVFCFFFSLFNRMTPYFLYHLNKNYYFFFQLKEKARQ